MRTQIHPTAIIDPKADIGEEVMIGPYAVIEAGARVGDYCEVRAHAVICGGTHLGPRNQVGYGAVLGAEPQDFAFKGQASRVEIGHGNRIREYATIHRATLPGGATRIGNDNFIMGGVHIAHDGVVGNRTILANNALLGGHSVVEDGAFLGGATVLHQFTRIGTLAITRGGTRLGKDVPPYFMAVGTNQVSGLNRIGLRRAGLSHETRRSIQAAYELIYRSRLNVTQALAELRNKFHQPEIAHLVAFIETSRRGICHERAHSAAEDDE